MTLIDAFYSILIRRYICDLSSLALNPYTRNYWRGLNFSISCLSRIYAKLMSSRIKGIYTYMHFCYFSNVCRNVYRAKTAYKKIMIYFYVWLCVPILTQVIKMKCFDLLNKFRFYSTLTTCIIMIRRLLYIFCRKLMDLRKLNFYRRPQLTLILKQSR